MKHLLRKPAALIITAAMLICSASCSGETESDKKTDDTSASTSAQSETDLTEDTAAAAEASSTTTAAAPAETTTTTTTTAAATEAATTTTAAATEAATTTTAAATEAATTTTTTAAATEATTTTTAAATEATTTTTTAAETKPQAGEVKTYNANESNVKLLGRTLTDSNKVLWLAHSASGIEFKFSGTKVSVALKGDGATGDPDSRARFAVYVDGKRTLDEMLDSKDKSYDIYSSDSAKEVTIKLVKLSESTSSTFGIAGITADGALTPTPAKSLKIEFIGDSITCGYGVDDEDKNHHFSTKTEDATKTYAYKTAEALDADYSLVSFSGHGVLSGYTSDGTINTDALVPPVYEQFTKTYGSNSGYFDEKTPWDFSRFVPDYIVINLGTNDSSYIQTKEQREEFTAAYVDFIKQVRKANPDAYIICSIGIMGGNSGVSRAVNTYFEETGDSRITLLQFSQQNESKNGLAADWHPTERTHAEAAEKLVNKINEIMNGSSSANAA